MEFGFKAMEGGECGIESCVGSSLTSGRLLKTSQLVLEGGAEKLAGQLAAAPKDCYDGQKA